MLKPQLVEASVVVLAQTHNPTIPSRDWLCNKKVFALADFQGEFEKQFVHTPVFATFQTPDFGFFIDESRLQINAKHPGDERQLASLIQKVETYVNALPETKYTAVGFNFAHTVEFPTAQEWAAFSQRRLSHDVLGAAMQLQQPAFETGLIFVWQAEQAAVRVVMEPKAGDKAPFVVNTNVHQVVPQHPERVNAMCDQLRHLPEYQKDIETRLTHFLT